jgi:hypothetical protein
MTLRRHHGLVTTRRMNPVRGLPSMENVRDGGHRKVARPDG